MKGETMNKALSLVAALVLSVSAAQAYTTYLDPGEFLAGFPLGNALVSFPAYTAVTTDAFGTPGFDTEPPGTGGTWHGYVECRSYAYPCLGAYAITYTFAEPILGLEGSLAFNGGYYNPPPTSARHSCLGSTTL
jgi:hypothetical protein